ncbi:MAG: AAA family ATPase [Saprospiraceae bacterium]
MPTTTLTIPVLVRPEELDGRNEYHIRPLFFDSPIATHRRYADAVSKFKGEVKRRFAGFELYRKNAEQLFWSKFDPEAKLSHFTLDFNIGNHYVKGNFAVAHFEWQHNTYAVLPNLGNFMFIVPPGEKGKPDLKGHTEKVARQLLKSFSKSEGNDFDASNYYSPKKEFITTIHQEVNIKVSRFSFELEAPLDIFAAFRGESKFDGGEEIEKVGLELGNLYPDTLRRAWYRDPVVQQVYDLVFHLENTPLVLIGPEGSGRHTIIEEVVWRYLESKEYVSGDEWKRHHIWNINPNRIIAGMSIVGHWEKRFEAILKYVIKPFGRKDFPDKILIDNPVALLRIGKAAQSDLTLSSVLKPYLEKRLLQLVLLATPEEWKIVQETDRGFSDLFQVLRLDEPDLQTTIKMVLQNRRALELQHECTISIPAIGQLFTIHRNFLKNKALPGSVMRLLQQLATKYSRQAIDAPEVREEFKSFSGLEETIFDENIRLERDDFREMLEHELVGQPAAVQVLSDAVHVIKAKLTDRSRPMASFLFIGPTGVGKTHAAKLLCKSLLGREDQLLRFDMNEYIDAGALHRLIGDAFNPEGQLTGKVRYRPFSVILLDEIEKAHPKIHDLLLQVLDDARLTDSVGRTVDFSNTIIIMTSNLGAREVGSQLGYGAGERDSSAVYRKAVENFFRPELVNRIERITVFNPLTFEQIQKIAQLQIRELLQRDGFVRRTTIVNVSPKALEWVAQRGYDAKMGGRALKRQIERDLTLLSAEQLIRTTTDAPVLLDIYYENDRLIPQITPLTFVQPLKDNWLPPMPEENSVGRFFYQLLKGIENIEDQIRHFETKKHKKSHLVNVDSEELDWKYYGFKDRVADLKEQIQYKQLRYKERRLLTAPALPFRMKRVKLNIRRNFSGSVEKEVMRDRLFQKEALQELREEYRHLTNEFDSFQSDYLISFFDLAFLQVMLDGFLKEKTEKVTFHFESCVTNMGEEEIEMLVNLYAALLQSLDIQYTIAGHKQSILAEAHNLRRLFQGEEGIHLFYLAHSNPIPVRITLSGDGQEPGKTMKVVRVYDGVETLTDLRTDYSNAGNMTPDEFKLLLYGGMKGIK